MPAEPLFRSAQLEKLLLCDLSESLVDGERSQSKSFSSCARIGRIFSFSASRSEERFSRNAETDIVCRLLLEKKKRSSVCGRLFKFSLGGSVMKLFSHLRVGRPHCHKTRPRGAARTPPRCRPYLERLEDRTAPAVSVLHSFAGMSFNDTTSGGEPPDTVLAAGPN